MKKSIVIIFLLINNAYCQEPILNSKEIEVALAENKSEKQGIQIKTEEIIPYYVRMANINEYQPSRNSYNNSNVNLTIPLIWYTESF